MIFHSYVKLPEGTAKQVGLCRVNTLVPEIKCSLGPRQSPHGGSLSRPCWTSQVLLARPKASPWRNHQCWFSKKNSQRDHWWRFIPHEKVLMVHPIWLWLIEMALIEIDGLPSYKMGGIFPWQTGNVITRWYNRYWPIPTHGQQELFCDPSL